MPLIATSTSASELVLRNRLRKSILFQNEDATNVVYIKREREITPTVSSSNHDHRIGPGGLIALNHGVDGEEAIQDRYTVIAGAGTPNVSVFETEDVVR